MSYWVWSRWWRNQQGYKPLTKDSAVSGIDVNSTCFQTSKRLDSSALKLIGTDKNEHLVEKSRQWHLTTIHIRYHFLQITCIDFLIFKNPRVCRLLLKIRHAYFRIRHKYVNFTVFLYLNFRLENKTYSSLYFYTKIPKSI